MFYKEFKVVKYLNLAKSYFIYFKKYFNLK